jgi:hypothetical protein
MDAYLIGAIRLGHGDTSSSSSLRMRDIPLYYVHLSRFASDLYLL